MIKKIIYTFYLLLGLFLIISHYYAGNIARYIICIILEIGLIYALLNKKECEG